MKTFPTLAMTLALALSVHAQLPVPRPVDPFVVTSNALQRALENNDTARINLLSNALQRIITARSGAAQTPAVTRPAAPPAVAQPVAPVVQPAAPPPNVAGAAAPAAPAAVPRVGVGPGGETLPLSGDPDEIVFPAGQLKLNEADLDPVLTIYQELTGRTVLRPASLPAAKITIKSQSELSRREAIHALDSILAMNQITMIPQGEKFVKAVPQAEAFQQAGQFNDIPTELLPEASMFVTEVVQLKNATPNDILPVIQPFAKLPGASIITVPSANILVLRDYAENVKRMVEMIERVDVLPVQEFEPVVIPIKYALASDIAQVLGSLTEGGGSTTTVGAQQTRTGLSTGGGGFGSRTGIGGVGGVGGYGGYGGSTGYNNPMNPMGTTGGIGGSSLSSGAAGRSSFADRLRSIVNRAATGSFAILGQTQIIADERTNALLIFASKQDLISISNIIEKIDVVLPQVLIEAIVMEVSLDDGLNYGFSYIQREPTTINDFTGLGAIVNSDIIQGIQNFPNIGSNFSSGFTYMARIGGFDAAMAAIATDSRINVISRPRIQTSHAVEANLFVGETRPYPTGSSYGGLYGSYNQIQQLQIGLTLSVLPLINPDGLVVMDIRERVQTIGGEIAIENVGNVPSTIDREANAKVSVRDGETIVLGGFISNEKRKSKSGVPILKDIPIFGALFRTANDTANRRELMIFIRPTVLPNPEQAAIAAKQEKENMPLISSGEREMIRDSDAIRRHYQAEAKRDEAADRRQAERDKKALEKEENKLLKREGLAP